MKLFYAGLFLLACSCRNNHLSKSAVTPYALSRRAMHAHWVAGQPYDPRPNIPLQQCQFNDICWAYATVNVLTASYARQHNLNPQTLVLSAQEIVDKFFTGMCNSGGEPYQALDKLKTTQFMLCDVTRYLESTGGCPTDGHSLSFPPGTVTVRDWGYVSGQPGVVPSVEDIQDAILRYGAVAADVSTANGLSPFPGDPGKCDQVFLNPGFPANTKVNHSVTIIGWDPAKCAWLVMSSSCQNECNGFLWIGYGVNNIGMNAVWAQSN